jgi:hypothetical protein
LDAAGNRAGLEGDDQLGVLRAGAAALDAVARRAVELEDDAREVGMATDAHLDDFRRERPRCAGEQRDEPE